MAQKKSRKARVSKAKQRLLETAERLFYKEGLRAVGVDRIVSEAQVAKMTLYKHFPSKDELILAVLVKRDHEFLKSIKSQVKARLGGGFSPIEAFFEVLKDWFQSPGFRGCSFINAAVELANAEHPAARFSEVHKSRFRQYLGELVQDSAGPRALAVVPAISLLVEGAIVTATMSRNAEAADTAKKGCLELLNAFR